MSEPTLAALASTSQQPASTTAAVEPVPAAGPEPVATPTSVGPAAASTIPPEKKELVDKQDEGPEPQSTLTTKFTEAEWSALKEFRV